MVFPVSDDVDAAIVYIVAHVVLAVSCFPRFCDVTFCSLVSAARARARSSPAIDSRGSAICSLEQVGLHDLRMTSFFTERGHKLQLSASDVALGVTALLEGPVSHEVDWTDNWRKATSALSPNHWPDLRQGIHLSMAHQRTILHQVLIL